MCLAVLDDHGANERPVLFLPWLETAHRPFADQVEAVVALQAVTRAIQPVWRGDPVRYVRAAGYEVMTVNSEQNGVGSMPTEQLTARLRAHRVEGIHSSQRSKVDGYGKVRAWLSDRRLVLPNHPDLLRQLRGITYEATKSGGLSIEAGNPNVHDDLADALYLAALSVPADFRFGPVTPEPRGVPWLETPAGVRIPRNPRPRPSSLRHKAGVLHAFG